MRKGGLWGAIGSAWGGLVPFAIDVSPSVLYECGDICSMAWLGGPWAMQVSQGLGPVPLYLFSCQNLTRDVVDKLDLLFLYLLAYSGQGTF